MIAPFDNVVFGVGGGGRDTEAKHSVNVNTNAIGAKDEQNQRANLFTSLNKLYQFEEEILLQFKNYEICSAAEGIDEKMDDNKEEVKSILCGSVISLDKIFSNFSKKFEEGGELHHIQFNQQHEGKKHAQINWVILNINLMDIIKII
jgi:hypothetical protein